MSIHNHEFACPANPNKVCPRLARISLNYLPVIDPENPDDYELTPAVTMHESAMAGELVAQTEALAQTVDCSSASESVCAVDALVRAHTSRRSYQPIIREY